ncbi:hypothetical protein BSFA1_80790 (plasmid) [Burkholderia sp. SFA1]|uniref:Uncharacterized protein n=1 Tax=Burkholderia vietnamiensis (strain G4 / LMG 22486) TaxID=269482 RepID=A4JU93_BURVG|nr:MULTISPECIES: hypothetical protein [Caballeronia]ABO59846.1 conserved hypothetical protein [Burkholderia vietnamiensis G4]AET95333.1 hypothetical protein BYI23_E001720 [Burkholderia sp. YI23]MCB4349992.1 hypothetical protein [Burkholderia vietnamiensis]BBQ02951.1 hypothetical protein BSFA1_80790 [Burkholderia sp. SFA1]MDR5798945.1 hypothetical protein [Caballeronia sp. LZ001]
MSPLIIARIALVIFAFIFLIGIKRRRRLFTVKTADPTRLAPLVHTFLGEELRENRLQLVLSGFFGALALTYIVYTLYVPAAVS